MIFFYASPCSRNMKKIHSASNMKNLKIQRDFKPSIRTSPDCRKEKPRDICRSRPSAHQLLFLINIYYFIFHRMDNFIMYTKYHHSCSYQEIRTIIDQNPVNKDFEIFTPEEPMILNLLSGYLHGIQQLLTPEHPFLIIQKNRKGKFYFPLN
jgi:hypothetical protein